MTAQTRTFQKKVIAAAKRDGTVNTLLWYVVGDVPGRGDIPADFKGSIPVIRVGPDPEATEHDAHLMLELCREHVRGALLRLELTAIDILDDAQMKWFEWGDLDLVCEGCGAVGWDSCCCTPTVWSVEPMVLEVAA